MLSGGGVALLSGGIVGEFGAVLGVFGAALGLGVVLGVPDGELGVTVLLSGWFGAVLGVVAVAPGVVVVELGVWVVALGVWVVAPGDCVVARGEFWAVPVPGVALCDALLPLGLVVLCPAPAALPAPADWANAQHPHSNNVPVNKSNLRVIVVLFPVGIEMAASLFRWDKEPPRCPTATRIENPYRSTFSLA